MIMYFSIVFAYAAYAPATALIPSFIPATKHKYSRSTLYATTNSANDHFVSKTFGSIFSASIIAVSCFTALPSPSYSAPPRSENVVTVTQKKLSEVDKLEIELKAEKLSLASATKTRDGFRKGFVSLQKEKSSRSSQIQALQDGVKRAKVNLIKANDNLTEESNTGGVNEKMQSAVDNAKTTLQTAEKELLQFREASVATDKLLDDARKNIDAAQILVEKGQSKVTDISVKIAADIDARAALKEKAVKAEKDKKAKIANIAKKAKGGKGNEEKKRKEKEKRAAKIEKENIKIEAVKATKEKEAKKRAVQKAKVQAEKDAQAAKKAMEKKADKEAKQLKSLKEGAFKDAQARIIKEAKLEKVADERLAKERKVKAEKVAALKKVEQEKAKLSKETERQLKKLENDRKALEQIAEKSKKSREKANMGIAKEKMLQERTSRER